MIKEPCAAALEDGFADGGRDKTREVIRLDSRVDAQLAAFLRHVEDTLGHLSDDYERVKRLSSLVYEFFNGDRMDILEAVPERIKYLLQNGIGRGTNMVYIGEMEGAG